MEQKKIHVITTGGTIEKIYDESDGSMTNKINIMDEFLHSFILLPHTKLCVHPLMNKDSLDIDEYDRQKICQKIERLISKDKAEYIVVIHGTDTMVQTALYCQKNSSSLNTAIVFTGAMKPFGFKDSDALQNIIEALTAVQLLQDGIYISFHNRIFDADKTRKNKFLKTFEPI